MVNTKEWTISTGTQDKNKIIMIETPPGYKIKEAYQVENATKILYVPDEKE